MEVLKCRGWAEWETLLEPGECECVTLLGQIISEIHTGSEKKKPNSGGKEKGKSCVSRDWVSALMLELPAVLGRWPCRGTMSGLTWDLGAPRQHKSLG